MGHPPVIHRPFLCLLKQKIQVRLQTCTTGQHIPWSNWIWKLHFEVIASSIMVSAERCNKWKKFNTQHLSTISHADAGCFCCISTFNMQTYSSDHWVFKIPVMDFFGWLLESSVSECRDKDDIKYWCTNEFILEIPKPMWTFTVIFCFITTMFNICDNMSLLCTMAHSKVKWSEAWEHYYFEFKEMCRFELFIYQTLYIFTAIKLVQYRKPLLF